MRAFGSVARGERWPAGMRQALIDATLPLFLECGRQLGPAFKTPDSLASWSAWRSVRPDLVELWRASAWAALEL